MPLSEKDLRAVRTLVNNASDLTDILPTTSESKQLKRDLLAARTLLSGHSIEADKAAARNKRVSRVP